MGKPADSQDNEDRPRSWARHLNWSKSKKQHSPSALPVTEPRVGEPSNGEHNLNTQRVDTQATLNESSNGTFDGEKSTGRSNAPVNTLSFAPTVVNTENEGEKPPAMTSSNEKSSEPKPPIPMRLKAGSKRFVRHTKNAITHSWINLLLIFVPIGIATKAAGLSPAIVFAMNAIAVIPLAGVLAHATETVASRLGDALGALLNVSFGNAVELIIFIALVKNEIRIVQASLLGSILANLLLILGMAFAAGGLRFQEQIYNNTVTQMSAVMLSLSVMSLLLPTAFHASFDTTDEADNKTLKVSRGTSVVLLLVYILYLLFQLKSHAYLYTSMPQAQIDEEAQPGILADVFETSSSSSSSSSSSDTDDTSGSRTTAKKIKRFIRKRRKSTSSSGDTPSVPSHMSSPSPEITASPSYFDDHARTSRRPSVILPDILSGDEGDDENRSRHLKVQERTGSESHSSDGRRAKKSKKDKKHKHKKHHRHRVAEAEEVIDEKPPMTESPAEIPTFEAIQAGGHHDGAVGTPARADTGNSKSSGMKHFARPTLPKLLSQNVFIDPPPVAPVPVNLTKARTGPAQRSGTGLRRTSSLPDRLNERAHSTPGNRALPTGRELIGTTLPPYANRGAWAARLTDAHVVSATDPDEPAEENMSRTAAVVMLLISTGLVAICAEFLVDAIPEMTEHSKVSQAFIGLIILPIVGNAAEHVTAVTVATKNKMDLAIGIAVGSSIQIALFITPVVVILGWCMNKEMSLYFNLFETVSLFVTVFVVNFLVLDGKSNYLEGVLLIAAYIIIAVAAFFYPDPTEASELGGADTEGPDNAKRMVMLMARSAFQAITS